MMMLMESLNGGRGGYGGGRPSYMRNLTVAVIVIMCWRLFLASKALGPFRMASMVDSDATTNSYGNIQNSNAAALLGTAGLGGSVSGATANRFRGDPVRIYVETRRFGKKGSSQSDGSLPVNAPPSLKEEPLYQKCHKWAVVTTIYNPSDSVKLVGNDLNDWCMVVVADTKTPDDYMQEAGWSTGEGGEDTTRKVQFLSVSAQNEISKMIPFVKLMPFQSFARKNIGYLYAIWMGATAIFDFDDDNLVRGENNKTTKGGGILGTELLADFTNETKSLVMVRHVSIAMDFNDRAFNPLHMMGATIADAWPRGMPLSLINSKSARGQRGPLVLKEVQQSNVAIIQSVCDHDPDVDAIFRLNHQQPFSFESSKAKAMTLEVPSQLYSPYNAQATLHFHIAFWGLYLPMTVNGRVSDIWRSYIVQRLLRELDTQAHVLYSPPIVESPSRNAHDNLGDLAAEQHLYLRTEALLEVLDNWQPITDKGGTDSLQARIEDLWIHLYERQFVEVEDVQAVQDWVAALEQSGYVFPAVKDHSLVIDPSTGGVKDRQECARRRLANWEEPRPTFMNGSNFGALTFEHSSNISVARLLTEYEVDNPFPHSVDLVVRAAATKGPWELATMIESVQLYWPKCAGRVLVVLDIGDEEFAHENIPSWIDVMYSKFDFGMPGRLGTQLFNMYSDQQGRSEYVAVIDTDTTLITPVTPDLVFNMEKIDEAGNAPPYILAETTYQKGMWSKGDQWMFKGDSNDWTFMVTLPTLWPRAMFPQYRAGVEAIHNNEFETTDLWQHFRATRKAGWMSMSQFCLLGNWMVKHWTDAPFDLRNETDIPPMRYGCHLPYYRGLSFGPGGKKDPDSFQRTGRNLMLDGLCELFCHETPHQAGSPPAVGLPKWKSCAEKCPNPTKKYKDVYFKYDRKVYGTPEQRLQVEANHFEPFKRALDSVFRRAKQISTVKL
ncbi:Protein of unknown function, DUF288 [Seminavis robusta]|uniref:Uncharacterized protein n=1 Tax=Seminavis robusta TaxID=568900 RepID=A0A9N8EMG3_9STRA|nr:Protein of unknown function, DUF288 [Seminavis robusta]|eukprot:Sro1259_g256920.1 Protein of unknown function, DUF288 (947) ;mRNA; r:12291-15131